MKQLFIILFALCVWAPGLYGQDSSAALIAMSDELFSNSQPSIGSSRPRVVVVEFFDYRCGACRRMHPVMEQLVDQHGDVRVVLMEFPVLGSRSQLLAKAALAAHQQGKFALLHDAFMHHNGSLPSSEQSITLLAKKLGIDTDQLIKDMNDPQRDKELDRIQRIARKLGVTATPHFFVSNNPASKDRVFAVRGMAPLPVFDDAVKKARGQ